MTLIILVIRESLLMTIFQRVDSRSGGRHFKKCYKGFVSQIERINNYSKKKNSSDLLS